MGECESRHTPHESTCRIGVRDDARWGRELLTGPGIVSLRLDLVRGTRLQALTGRYGVLRSAEGAESDRVPQAFRRRDCVLPAPARMPAQRVGRARLEL